MMTDETDALEPEIRAALRSHWAPLITQLWKRLVDAAPAAAALREHDGARVLVEEVFRDWHSDGVGPSMKPAPYPDWRRQEIVGEGKNLGLAPGIVALVEQLIGNLEVAEDRLEVDGGEGGLEAVGCDDRAEAETVMERPEAGVQAAWLRIAAQGSTNEDFRKAATDLDEAFQRAWLPLEELRRAAERLVEVTPEQGGGKGVLTQQLRDTDAKAIGTRAARAWRIAGLPLGGPGKSNEGFANFLRELHLATTGRPKIPGEPALLAELRRSLPSPEFR